MKTKLFFPLFLFLFFTLTSNMGQTKRNMSIIDFLNIPGISNPALSPDGKQFVYTLSSSNWEKNRQISHIWRQNLDGESPIQLTNGLTGESNPQWSPDGKYISFIAKRKPSEHNQVYLISNFGGEAIQLTHHETAVRNVQWSPDGGSIYFQASDPKTDEEEQQAKLNDDVYAKDENYKQVHLWTMGLEDSEAHRLTEGDFSVNRYSLSRDGNTIVHSRGISPLYDESTTNEIWLMNNKGEQPRQLSFNNIPESSASLSPDGRQILFIAGANEAFDSYYNSNLFLLPAKGGDPVMLLEDIPYDINAARWTGEGKSILLLMNMGAESQLFTYDIASKKLKQVTEGNHSIGQWDYNWRLNLHIFSVNHSKNPGDFYFMAGEDFKSADQISHVYDYLEEEFSLPRQEKISWKGADGVEVEGLLYYPADYKEDNKYPLVVQTHGGPASSDKYGFSRSNSRYNAVLAGKGYMVLQPNYRGSTGYGDDFLRDMVGSYFKNSHLDVMAGVDYLVEKGLADPDKLIKMGWSAGGHMTNKLITFTDRFKAASSGAGAANWISMYGQSDVRIYRTPWFGGTPWQENAPIDLYWEQSPLKDIHKVTTPTIFLVGGNDVRVPPPQSVEMYRALKSNNVPTHLYIAPREPHGWRELHHRLFKINVELDWFATYALNEDYTWEIAPSEE